MKYNYPAILTPGDGGVYVGFPDLPECFTDGDNMDDAIRMANDALSLCLYEREEHKEEIPKATSADKLPIPQGSFIAIIQADTTPVRKLNEKRSVRKNITIPAYLDTLIKEHHLNLSNFVQNALMKKFRMSSVH
ncbi:type II toxin-antitoxin system HicB family antitoxin [uncultured Selenomonas sp.]|uniref:type II toxin-antitoxin system HicB family antitoxin n=1 Tax=uncultured Selenomonas sp. TaxID=159275 RepID=UPI0025863FC0|nr:type II toxin-antitoxin system HicB family antitoxin [uncultured Selenomonas sp.]